MTVAIIPARGGSKRIPKKNIKKFLGKPIIAYSIETALATDLFDDVIVSTDSDEISEIAIQYGAKVPFIRPEILSDDFSGTHDVVGHAVKFLEDAGKVFDYVCCIYATAPLIQISDLVEGFDVIKNGNMESVMAATKYSYPIFRSFEKLPSGGLKMIFPEHYTSRSQDLPDIYHDAGQFYWAKPDIWKRKAREYNDRNAIVEIPNYRVQDIDNIEDWKNAEIIYQLIESSKL